MSVQRLRDQTPTAEDLLTLLSFLAADDTPRTLPTQHSQVLPERLAATICDPLAYQQAIGALRHDSLINATENSLSVHRLVQAVTRHQLNPQEQRHWATAALRLVRAAFPGRCVAARRAPGTTRV